MILTNWLQFSVLKKINFYFINLLDQKKNNILVKLFRVRFNENVERYSLYFKY